MGNLGERLKAARNAKGITLIQAEEDTKIRKRYLEALENEEFNVIPGVVYTKGFLKTYAGYLGLDQDEVMTEFRLFNIREEKPPRPQVRFQEYTAPRRKKSIKWRPSFLTVLLAVAAVITLFIFNNFWNNYSGKTEKTPTDNLTRTETPVEPQKPPAPADSGNKQPAVVPDTVYGSGYGQPQNPAPGQQLNLVLTTKNQVSWVRVDTDGVKKFSGTMTPGQVQTFNANDNIKIVLGNAGAVEVTYNGRNLGLLGPLGTVKKQEFSRNQIPVQASP